MARIALPASRILGALISALAATVCLVLLVLTLAGPAYFVSVFGGAAWYVVAISVVAGVLRLFCSRGGVGVSAACGAVVAITGFVLILWFALSNI